MSDTCSSKRFAQLNIEIINTQADPWPLLTYPVVQNSLFVKSWNILRPIVQAILGETDWALVYVIRRMEEHCDRDPITITITVAEDSTKEWTYGPVGKQYSLEYHDLHIFRDKIGQLLDSRSIAKLSSIYAAATSGTPIKKPAATLREFINLLQEASGSWERFGITNILCVVAEVGFHSLYNGYSQTKGSELEIAVLETTSFGESAVSCPAYTASWPRVNPQERPHWVLVDIADHLITEISIDSVDLNYKASYIPPGPVMTGTATIADGERLLRMNRELGLLEGYKNMLGNRTDSNTSWKCKSFGDLRDSGSFIIGRKGQFVGLYVGDDRNCGLIIESLFEDIKRVTKCHDVWI
ncbi:uncharacterized protein MCYG_02364 [Microsporum canis CBS 113480]|uniref:Uncharacterized protein n=1 Tax=Arthroderma otae (strain ATCC MYA-4605 / CBS 113480) TaxID=554155 RepID=C5FJC4_ARTOC|nr:uncharacterized protein MCYG_02364 [Microsporum canis CBS 113480]EEQ29545.1 predicted protein [Microsporum canis CBS 113480]